MITVTESKIICNQFTKMSKRHNIMSVSKCNWKKKNKPVNFSSFITGNDVILHICKCYNCCASNHFSKIVMKNKNTPSEILSGMSESNNYLFWTIIKWKKIAIQQKRFFGKHYENRQRTSFYLLFYSSVNNNFSNFLKITEWMALIITENFQQWFILI